MQRSDAFKRLPAKRWGVIRRATLWDAGEYLLSVSGTSFSERYHRFYYRDIRSIVVQKGPRLGSIGGLVLLAAAVMTLAVVPFPFRWLVLIPLAWLAWTVYVNLARSCRVFVYTAVSSEELPALFRRSAADRVLPQILAKIREAQGGFEYAPAEASVRSADVSSVESESELLTVPRVALYSAFIFYILILGSAGFAYWYSDALLTPASLRSAKVAAYVLNALQVASGVGALMKFFRIRRMNAVRTVILIGLGLLALRFYTLMLIQFQLQVQKGSLMETMLNVHLRHWVGTGDCGLSLLVAIIGLISLTASRSDNRPGSTFSF